jgi:hypothetical protein
VGTLVVVMVYRRFGSCLARVHSSIAMRASLHCLMTNTVMMLGDVCIPRRSKQASPRTLMVGCLRVQCQSCRRPWAPGQTLCNIGALVIGRAALVLRTRLEKFPSLKPSVRYHRPFKTILEGPIGASLTSISLLGVRMLTVLEARPLVGAGGG